MKARTMASGRGDELRTTINSERRGKMDYERWLTEVETALDEVNMPMADWQSVWPFDFGAEFEARTTPELAAMKANRFWWYQQNKSLNQDCRKTPDCWLPRGHSDDCQPVAEPTYQPGDYVKVEFDSEDGMPGEWMWAIVQSRDDKKRVVFAVLDNEPINEYGGKVKLGSQLAISYGKVREHRKATDFSNSRPSGTKETEMNAERMKSLNPGDILVYDDGRPGHSGVKAVILSNYSNCLTVQFEDRADTTTIKHDDVEWTKYLKRP
jgi:hypothetical protein